MTSVALEKICLTLGRCSTLPSGKYSVSGEVFIMHKKIVVTLLMHICLSVTQNVCGGVCLLSITYPFLLMAIFFLLICSQGNFRGMQVFTQISQKQLSSPDVALFITIILFYSILSHTITLNMCLVISLLSCLLACLLVCLFACLWMCVKWWVCESYRPSWPLTSH